MWRPRSWSFWIRCERTALASRLRGLKPTLYEFPEVRRSRASARVSAYAEVFEIIARFDPLGPSERRVVEIRGRVDGQTIFHGDRCHSAGVEARLGLARPVPFHLVQRAQHHHR